ncbi:MAG: hypothetical protein U1A77_25575 [Pirellulales bacterium]
MGALANDALTTNALEHWDTRTQRADDTNESRGGREDGKLDGPNDQGNPAAAKNHCFQNRPDPPLGLSALLGAMWASDRSTANPPCGIVPNLPGKCNQVSDPSRTGNPSSSCVTHQQRINRGATIVVFW